jgi:arylsulfatase A-like enzyme
MIARPRLSLALLAAGSCAFLPLADAQSAPASAQPNIIVILADDLGYGDLTCYGATKVFTPQLDRLARGGVRFTQGYAPAATCTPSRYAMFTGEYGWRQPPSKTNILPGDAPLAIEPGRYTLPAMLRQAGYRTGAVGKWHLGVGDGVKPVDFNGKIAPGPLEVGFDEAFFMPATADRVPTVYVENHSVFGLDPADPIKVSYTERIGSEPTGTERPDLLRYRADEQHGQIIVNRISRIGFMTGGVAARWIDEDMSDTFTARAEKFIEAHRARPFFLYLGLNDPHVPRAPHPRFLGTSESGIRGDAIHQIDHVVGRVLAKLEALKLTENTLIVFSSDNGPVLFDGYFDEAAEKVNGHSPAGVLRGWKYLAYEGGTRVPFIAHWPARLRPGVNDKIISIHDLLATFAAIVGQKIPEGAAPDSLNQLPVLLDAAAAPVRTEIVQQGVASLAIRVGDWKLIPATPMASQVGTGGANPNDTRFAQANTPEPLLFNLRDDPGESYNLAPAQPEKVAELAARLAAIKALPGATR